MDDADLIRAIAQHVRPYTPGAGVRAIAAEIGVHYNVLYKALRGTEGINTKTRRAFTAWLTTIGEISRQNGAGEER